MNISELNNEIYRFKSLREGDYANFIMRSIENQDIVNFNNMNKEIKF